MELLGFILFAEFMEQKVAVYHHSQSLPLFGYSSVFQKKSHNFYSSVNVSYPGNTKAGIYVMLMAMLNYL